MDRHNLPNTFEVYSQVIVDQNVPESGNGAPVHLWMKDLQTIGDPLSGLGEGLEIAQNGVLNQLRSAKSLLTILAIAIYPPHAIEDVLDVQAVVLHNGIAS
jgi:hypothetical protein